MRFAAVALATAALASVAVFWQPASVAGQAMPAPDTLEYYNTKVVPVFEANCYRCHGGMNHRGGLSMATKAGMLKGGHTGSVLVPGHPEDSLLIKLIRHEGPKNDPMDMPPNRPKISDEDIAVVTAWVKAGAIMPE